MTAEQIMVELSFVDQRYIEEASGGKAIFFSGRRLMAMITAAALALLLISCSVVSLSEEAVRGWFLQYDLEQYLLRMSEEDIQFLDVVEDYALVFYGGMGPSLQLYHFKTEEERISIIASATGDYSISGGISINHLETDGRHIYFGTVSDSHWDPIENITQNYTPKSLYLTDEAGVVAELDISGEGGYLCVLDAPLADFRLIGHDGKLCLDYELYRIQGYTVEERQWLDGTESE